jgi:hypothetical protein
MAHACLLHRAVQLLRRGRLAHISGVPATLAADVHRRLTLAVLLPHQLERRPSLHFSLAGWLSLEGRRIALRRSWRPFETDGERALVIAGDELRHLPKTTIEQLSDAGSLNGLILCRRMLGQAGKLGEALDTSEAVRTRRGTHLGLFARTTARIT